MSEGTFVIDLKGSGFFAIAAKIEQKPDAYGYFLKAQNLYTQEWIILAKAWNKEELEEPLAALHEAMARRQQKLDLRDDFRQSTWIHDNRTIYPKSPQPA